MDQSGSSTPREEAAETAVVCNIGLSHKGTPPMDDRAICLPWDNLTPLGQTVVYGELRKIY